jgi:hypothetical protein
MRRCVEPEWLDELPANDRRAMQSRRDLTRLNAFMRHASFVAGALVRAAPCVRKVVDIGAGDGQFLLKVARIVGCQTREAVTVDRLELVQPKTLEGFRAIGWRLTVRIGDVFELLSRMSPEPCTAILANLFLHHFDDKRLRQLFDLQAGLADIVIACEPRRSPRALIASRLVGLLGCNSVTRHDAVASVRAGFTGSELTALWGNPAGWCIEEKPFGLFSHGFVCRRK